VTSRDQEVREQEAQDTQEAQDSQDKKCAPRSSSSVSSGNLGIYHEKSSGKLTRKILDFEMQKDSQASQLMVKLPLAQAPDSVSNGSTPDLSSH
jgi:hypothetical protein